MNKVPLVKNAKIQKTMLGKYEAKYPCPYCKKTLTSKANEIGEPEDCPHCSGLFLLSNHILDEINQLKKRNYEDKIRKKEEKAKRTEQKKALKKKPTERKRVEPKFKRRLDPVPLSEQVEFEDEFSEVDVAERKTQCPFCMELIISGSKKCKHCGEYLDSDLREQNQNKVKKWEPVVALILSIILPGAGQLYKGQAGNGILWFFLTVIGYMAFLFPGVILHVCCIIGAASGDPYK